MINAQAYKFSVTIASNDYPTIGVMRAISWLCQDEGYRHVSYKGTGEEKWRSGGRRVTFRFTQSEFRDKFITEAERLLRDGLWTEVGRSDNDSF